MNERPSKRRLDQDRRARSSLATDAGLVVLLVALVAAVLVAGEVVASAATRSAAPPPATVVAPSTTPSPTLALAEGPFLTYRIAADPTAIPVPTTTPRIPVDTDLLADPGAFFLGQVSGDLCAASAVQMAIAILVGTPDQSKSHQVAIHDLEVSLTTLADSHNGGVGPLGMAEVITQLSGVPYELRIYDTETAAMLAAAMANSALGEPAVLLALRGQHALVMTGFRADADPALFPDAAIAGAYILDPWYPLPYLWGASHPAGTFETAAKIARRFLLPWKRPEGAYPGRDGKFLILLPADTPA